MALLLVLLPVILVLRGSGFVLVPYILFRNCKLSVCLERVQNSMNFRRTEAYQQAPFPLYWSGGADKGGSGSAPHCRFGRTKGGRRQATRNTKGSCMPDKSDVRVGQVRYMDLSKVTSRSICMPTKMTGRCCRGSTKAMHGGVEQQQRQMYGDQQRLDKGTCKVRRGRLT